MAFYMDVSVRNYLASYNKRFTKGRKLKRLNFSIYLFKNKQIPFSDKTFSPNVLWHRFPILIDVFRKRDTLKMAGAIYGFWKR